MNAPKLVVFDLGGVVVRICRSWREAAAAAGLAWRERVMDPELVARRKPIVRRYEVGGMEDGAFFEAVSASMDGLYSPEEVRAAHLAWIIEEYAGIGRVIEDLHTAGVATGVLSNTNAAHWRQLVSGAHGAAKFPTVERARHVHASHLLGMAKPDAAVYGEFCRRTGSAGCDVLFFDDLEENVQAARNAGWRAERIDHTGDTARQVREHLGRHGVLKNTEVA